MENRNWKLENRKLKLEKVVILSEAKNLGSPKRPLTRPAAADESAASVHPLPKGEGSPIGVHQPTFDFPVSDSVTVRRTLAPLLRPRAAIPPSASG
jgi:hypothetical protein